MTTDAEVKARRAEDRTLSMFDEENKAKIDEQRASLALAPLYPKPRPMWMSPAMVAFFGDAYFEGTMLEGGSLLAWNFGVFLHSIKRMLTEQSTILSILSKFERVALSDVFHIMHQSAIIFSAMAAMIKNRNESQLISFLRKIKKLLINVELGDSLMLPLLIEWNSETNEYIGPPNECER